jgi:uncharacterized protein YjiS (DUF1127 family)
MIRRPVPPKVATLKTSVPRPPPRRVVVPKASAQEGVQIAGAYIGLVVLFTSSMNWWRYRRTREEIEKNRDKE